MRHEEFTKRIRRAKLDHLRRVAASSWDMAGVIEGLINEVPPSDRMWLEMVLQDWRDSVCNLEPGSASDLFPALKSQKEIDDEARPSSWIAALVRGRK